MDLMDDEDTKKSVIDQMMGELDGVTSDSLKRKPEGAAKGGVEISISVTPKTGDEMEKSEEDAGACMDPDCDDPMHDHTERDAAKDDEPGDYISGLLKKLG